MVERPSPADVQIMRSWGFAVEREDGPIRQHFWRVTRAGELYERRMFCTLTAVVLEDFAQRPDGAAALKRMLASGPGVKVCHGCGSVFGEHRCHMTWDGR